MDKEPVFNCEESSLGLYQCQYCVVKTNIKIFFYGHLQNFHAKNKKSFTSTLFSKRYTCKICNFSTFSLLLLFKHNLTCPEKIRQLKESIAKNQCLHCSKKMFNSATLKRHITRIHTAPEKIKWYKCDQCNYQGKVKENLRHHIRKQHKLENEVYYCNFCGYTSEFKLNVKRHIDTKHTPQENVPKHECKICKYKSLSKGALKVHVIRMHTAPEEMQWYQCLQCTYKSKIKGSLTYHVKKKHMAENKQSLIT